MSEEEALAARVDAMIERLRVIRTLPPAAERKRIREAAGVSQRQLASAMGVSWTAVQRWEEGANPRDRAREYAAVLERLREFA